MRHFLFAFNYLLLRNDKGHLIIWRDIAPLCLITVLIDLPFYLIKGSIFFGSGGFVDKAANLTACLTGFYIAGLLAVATFAASSTALDNPIKIGPVFWTTVDKNNKSSLTRREYVCSIFGYLAFLSLLVSLISGIVTGIYLPISTIIKGKEVSIDGIVVEIDHIFSIVAKVLYTIPMVHLLITSGYGLYYLITKIYDKTPAIKQSTSKSSPGVVKLD